ncbi:DUF4215 domain-containing protein [Polyangium spumosum]|uniref:DUF4215 domain-containing protein n=1 Tax=Polyangium spumosum TaxID=889282 RepID=A0A6N7PUN4_9BACT|nr:DUF4215 domain-containing protein [Polyangium spumosum]MRG95703.1 DUF4215 domain-containing protein [Polyangium spumosum]
MRFLASLATAAMLTAGSGALSGCSDDAPGGTGGTGGQAGGGGNNQGGSGNQGGQGGQGGSMAECAAADECPGADTDCATRTCDGGVCGFTYAPQGTATTDQSSGDCKQSVCDGQGEVTSVEDPTDVLDDANPCTEDTCNGDTPTNENLAIGTACDVDGGKVCDGEGKCVECTDPGECTSGVCTENTCVPPTCTDTVKNGSETDVDCGGPDCLPCDDTLVCVEATDCKSGVCTDGTCAAPICDDTVENGEETDVDCGGPSCSPCGPDKGCVVDGDCVGGTCSGSICVPTCTDGEKNANETDADCGGPLCQKCEATQTCSIDADCVSDVCAAGVCAAPSCDDGKQNGDETGMDCGGPTCGPCGDGLGCAGNTDCVSGVCTGNVCQAAVCGDGVKNGVEECDDGNQDDTDACPSTCKLAACGDTFVQAGVEECDDGNQSNTDACPSTCKVATCGDTFVQIGVEDCDDGNQSNTDACVEGCKFAACGDAFVEAGVEACDDGNQDNTDACLSSCTAATCGDAFVQVGVEQCDDGNQDNTDGCVTGCLLPTCGDGFKQAGVEQCDDGNTAAGDCCAPGCTVEAGCELEPNSTCATAQAPVAAPVTINGAITPIGDQDFFAFTVPATADLKIETFEGALGACPSADTVIQFRGADCTTVITSDDQDGINSCSMLDSTIDAAMRRVAPGTYYVRVEDWLNDGTIPGYLLDISFNALCGDGVKQGSEMCDDGNVANGDGCASNCTIEATPEVEPNDTCAAATGPFVVPQDANGLLLTGAITPVGDDDWFAFTLPGTADVHIETYDMNGPGTCASVDTVIQLYSDCATPLGPEQDQGAIGNCSRIDPNINTYARKLPAGTYRVKVIDYLEDTVIAGYKLQVKLTALCGNGVVEGTEECDGSPGCTATCETIKETVCNDGIDDDGDGNVDCADAECAFACSVPCGAGETLVAFGSTDTPMAIPDEDFTTSTINVPVPGTVTRAVVRLNIAHTWAADVDVSLSSPAGTLIDLTSDNGSSDDNYTNTILDDTCANPIASGTAPFTGCYSPETPLTTFNGQASAGAWQLAVADDEAAIVGTLNNWSLALCVAP